MRELTQPRSDCLMYVSMSSREASLRRSTMRARPPSLSTRCISFIAATGCEKFLNAARHKMRSKVLSRNGIAEALPWRKSRSTCASRVAVGDLDEGVTDVEASDLVATAPRNLYGEIARARGHLQDAAACRQHAGHALRQGREIRHVARRVARVPGRNPTFHADALVALVCVRFHLPCSSKDLLKGRCIEVSIWMQPCADSNEGMTSRREVSGSYETAFSATTVRSAADRCAASMISSPASASSGGTGGGAPPRNMAANSP